MRYLPVAATWLLGMGVALGQQQMGRMQRLKSLKEEQWAKMREEGAFDESRYRSISAATPCVNGKAGEYACDKVDMLAFLSHQDMGSRSRAGNDVWGWTSPDGREFGAVGQTDGTAFVEINDDGSLKYLGRLPTQTVNSDWRDMKVINGYVYIGAESRNHGLQIFDMRKLLDIEEPRVFDLDSDLTALFDGFGSSHNIVAHEDKNMIYAVGTAFNAGCRGGLFMVDVSDPSNPTSPGCLSEDGYVHDAQCVTYTGPDKDYWGREICFGYNEDTLTIMDVTDKSAPKIISRAPYNAARYTHQGWLIDPVNMTYLLLDDELDEQEGSGPASNGRTTTYIWDVKSLKKPVNTGTYQSPAKAIDHNLYVLDGLAYESNYGSGLRIVDVRSVERDPSGTGFSQAGYFDCRPEDDAQGGRVEFAGSWSVYPYFPSGVILLNSIERGVYALRYTGN